MCVCGGGVAEDERTNEILRASKRPLIRQPYHPAAQDRLPTEAKQG